MIAALAGTLVIGSIGFWILMGLVSVCLIAALEYEKAGWATFSAVVTFLLLGLFGDFNVWTATTEHPFLAIGAVLIYLAVGTLYSFGKWWRYVKLASRKLKDEIAEFLAAHKLEGDKIPDELLEEWLGSPRRSGYRRRNTKPIARENKARIMSWMVYWPWSMFWTVINDPIKKAFKAIFQELQATYQRISDKAFEGIEDNFRDPPAPPPAPTGASGMSDDGAPTPPSNGGGGRQTVGYPIPTDQSFRDVRGGRPAK